MEPMRMAALARCLQLLTFDKVQFIHFTVELLYA